MGHELGDDTGVRIGFCRTGYKMCNDTKVADHLTSNGMQRLQIIKYRIRYISGNDAWHIDWITKLISCNDTGDADQVTTQVCRLSNDSRGSNQVMTQMCK